ncbi:MAG: TolC family outer membrane protein [Sulfurimonadaceae bacterium]|jgi:adhesin transport system outer membrane protein|nr:TolC family outer membrane protein [Sulfurimonadaceae bacterium]
MKKTILLALSAITLLQGQDLRTTVNEVISSNPTVQERLKNYNSTKEDTTTATSGYYPKLDLTLGVGTERTKQSDRPSTPNSTHNLSVYQNSLMLTQNIFKGWETTYKVKQQEYRTFAAAYSYVDSVNSLAFEAVNSYLQVMRQKELLDTAQENININQEIFEKVQKLYDAGLTTLSEVNKIESSLALARSNYVVQENTLLDVTYNLHKVLGRYLDVSEMEKPQLLVALPADIEAAARFAMQNNPALLINKNNIKQVQASYHEQKSAFYPQLDLEVSQNMNKNLSGIEGKDDRFRAMVFLKYNLFNGFADQAALQKGVSEIHKEVESANALRRDVIEKLNLAWAANEKLNDQLEHLTSYRDYALKTLTLYVKEYDLGRRSLLDLLSAQNDFIGAKSQIINTEYSMLYAKYRILNALGTLVPTVIGDLDAVYANVGLKGQTPENEDTLPIDLDKDKDLISDNEDLCNNSLLSDMRSVYGCKLIYEDTQRIERYSGFVFQNQSDALKDEGFNRLNSLIAQIKEYGFAHMKFDILGHVDDTDLSQEELLSLSQKRAEVIKAKLLEAGALEENIVLHAKADSAPLLTNELSKGQDVNNRADIIIRKLKK